ncbi:hypothetical protein CI1B_32690 [Bradyrhizobium ivorense]|uniref:Uncharacterized protein n=1 Tax=Bradyrhizobium ivorense TaxID=2511166 RepID=A0A508T5D7_9BRAD|nr:hypothetical protein CI1B_32690 [Bradyrhizobium ivorense]
MRRRESWLSSSVLVHALAHDKPHEPFRSGATMALVKHDGVRSDVISELKGAGDLQTERIKAGPDARCR